MVRVFKKVLNQSRGGNVLLCRTSYCPGLQKPCLHGVANLLEKHACQHAQQGGGSPTLLRGVLVNDSVRVLSSIQNGLRPLSERRTFLQGNVWLSGKMHFGSPAVRCFYSCLTSDNTNDVITP